MVSLLCSQLQGNGINLDAPQWVKRYRKYGANTLWDRIQVDIKMKSWLLKEIDARENFILSQVAQVIKKNTTCSLSYVYFSF